MQQILKLLKIIQKSKWIILIILFVAAALRLYKIEDYMLFLGDEGRDATIVARFLQKGDLMFVGPGTSVGNMYLGPIYYYLMAPALLLANYSPVGPAVMVALFGVATVYLIWKITWDWTHNRFASYLTSFLYAISPVVIIYSRSSWNPNIMPFFALLVIYSLWQLTQTGKWIWFTITCIAFSFVTQSHYLGLFLLPVIIIFWIYNFFFTKKIKFSKAFIYSSVSFFIIFASSLPLIIFDAKYQWRNFKALDNFLFSRGGDFTFKPLKYIPNLWTVWTQINTGLLAGRNEFVGIIISLFFVGWIILFFLKKNFKGEFFKKTLLLLTWIGFGVAGLALYKGTIYDHYYGFLFPAPFILLGVVLNDFSETTHQKIKNVFFTLVFFGLSALLILQNPLRNPPNRLLERSIKVSSIIKQEAGEKRFNFALIGDKNYEPAYQYFLELWKTPIIEIDPQRYEQTVAEQLFVVCEYPQEKCSPTSNPKAQVANFGWSKIDKIWEVEDLSIYKLIHNIQK